MERKITKARDRLHGSGIQPLHSFVDKKVKAGLQKQASLTSTITRLCSRVKKGNRSFGAITAASAIEAAVIAPCQSEIS